MKRFQRVMKGLASVLCIAGAGVVLARWARRGLARDRGEGEMDGQQIMPTNCAGASLDRDAVFAQVGCRVVLPIPVPAGRLRLLQLLAGLLATCLGIGVYLLMGEPQSNGIAAGSAVFVAAIEGFLTWLLPALFVEAS